MYQPRRISNATIDRPEADAPAFRIAPRRAARTRVDLLRSRIAPVAVSATLVATAGVLTLNFGASPSTAAVPAPVRTDDAVSRDAARGLVSEDAGGGEEATVETPAEAPAESPAAAAAATFTDGAWQAAFGKVTGEQYTQSTVYVRAQASEDSAQIGEIARGEKVSVTDQTVNDYRQVNYDGKVGWVWVKRLGDQPPPEPTPSATAAAGGAPAAAAPASSNATFLWPTEGGISSPWGMRKHPILGYTRLHGGADIGGNTGAPIYAVMDGTVTKAATGYNSGSGNNVRIDHGSVGGKQLETGYLHMSKLNVSAGQRVKRGQVIGTVGSTGLSTAPHLHFSVYVNGTNSNPAPYLGR